MSLGFRRGANEVASSDGKARLLAGPPLIAPARAYTFPREVAGEEEALARGALWVEVQSAAHGGFLAQCALGFATAGVAYGLWPLGRTVLAVAGGYAYRLDLANPERTVLLDLRPVVEVLPVAGGLAVLAGYHSVCIVGDETAWQTPRLSWEGLELTRCDGDLLRGNGWDMLTDEEVPFTVDLRTRVARGGGYRIAGSTGTETENVGKPAAE